MLAETYRGYPRLLSRYVTPATEGDSITYRLLSFPDNATIRQALLDVVQMLGHNQAWIQQAGIDPDKVTPIFTELVKQLTEDNPMIGAIIPYMTNQLPDNVLPCNGNTYNRAEYPKLYDLLPASLIVDIDTFKTPDFTDRTARGSNDLTHFVSDTGGSNSVTISVDQMPSHTHSNPPHSHIYHQYIPIGIDIEGMGLPDPTAVSNLTLPMWTEPNSITINPTGGGQPVDITPSFVAVNYAIVAR